MKSNRFVSNRYVVFAMLTLLIISATPAQAEATGGTVVNASGEVQLQHPNAQNWEAVTAGTTLHAGDVIRTGTSGQATVVLSDETLMRINSNTTFLFREIANSAGWTDGATATPTAATTPPSSSYAIDQGEVWLRNKNRAAAITVTSPSISASIRGTEFAMSHAKGQRTTLSVLEGSVNAENRTGSITVGKNEQLTAGADEPLHKTVLLTPNDAVQWILAIPMTLSSNDRPLQSRQGQPAQQEIAALEQQLASSPNDTKILAALARLYRDTGKRSEAAALAARVLTLRSSDADAAETAATIALDEGQPAEALPLLAPLAGRSPGLTARYVSALRLTGQIDQAARVLDKALASNPNSHSLLLERALLELNNANPRAALATATQALSQPGDASDASLWMVRALTELTLQDTTQAQQSAQQAVALAPQSATALVVQSQIYQAVFNLDAAQSAIDAALQLDPHHELALLNDAKLRFGSGHLEQSLSVINRAAAEYPRNGEIQNVRGFILLSLNRSAEAKAAFQDAVKLRSSLGEPHLGLSLLAMRRGEVNLALEEISAAVALEPRRSLFLSYWAKMLYQLKRFKQALDMLSLASDLDPRDPTPHLYRAIILRDLNRPTEAIESLQTAFELNNNRAVYRSTFLLDQDLAVKNIDLSILFDQLGLSEWALSSAVNSVKRDYLNYSAHLFLSGVYSDLEARDTARDTELLLAEILLPANNNSFNTYNDYTSFLETPTVRGSVSGTVGNKDTQGGDIVVNGGLPEWGIAGGATANRSMTDGYRETNPEQEAGGAAQLKYDPTVNDSIFLGYVSTESFSQDNFQADYEIDAPVDPLEQSRSRGSAATLGYHHRFSPELNFISALQYSETWFAFQGHDVYDLELDDGSLTIDELSDRRIESSSYALQGQFQYRMREHQFLVGSIFNWGDDDQFSNSVQRLPIDGELFDVNTTESDSQQDQRYQGEYAYHIWTPTTWLSTELGLYHERIEDADGFSDTKTVQEGVDPRAGIILRPSDNDTIRLAAYRYIVPFLQSPRFDPSDVAGILVYRNTLEATKADEASVAWEHSWHTGFVGTSAFYLERESSFKLDRESERFYFDGRYHGAEVAVNQLLWNGFGFVSTYRFLHANDEFDSDINRDDHLVRAAITFLDSSGLGGRVGETYRRESFTTAREDENIWLTDARLSYELPDKRGYLVLAVSNIFDQKFNWVTGTGNIIGREPSRAIVARVILNF